MEVVFLDDELNPQNMTDEKRFGMIVKYMSLENALRSFQSIDNSDGCYDWHEVWFSNPSKWKDPYESYFLKNSPYEGKILAQCFTKQMMSEAQWMMYSKDEIAIKFTYDWIEFIDALKNLNEKCIAYIGNVKYQSTNQIKKIKREQTESSVSPEQIAHDLLLKRPSYSYEEEIRIILVYGRQLAKSYSEGKALGPFDIDGLIKRITICPSAKEYTAKLLKQTFHSLSGIKEVYQSELYKPVE